MIDLRSDTVTQPSRAMRRAMAAAEVGDDVWGEDPTVNALQDRAAELCGTESALLVTSGSMGNLVGLVAHVPRGGEIIGPAEVHTFSNEGAGHAAVVGASARTIPAREDGRVDPRAVKSAFRDPTDIHEPATSLIILENTHSLSMGQPLTPTYTAEIAAIASDGQVPLFIDGARLFDAAVALQVPASALIPPGASATFCLSKSLACPVGSLVVGSHDFISRARRARKMLGGGMRQAGILAAAGLVALQDGGDGMIERLVDDHTHARILAEALASMPGVTRLDPGRVRTNFVLFGLGQDSWLEEEQEQRRVLGTRAAFLRAIRHLGVRMIEYPNGLIRAIPHYGIERPDIEKAIRACRAALAEVGLAPSTASMPVSPQ